MNDMLDFLNQKHILGIFFTLVVIFEISRGFFKTFPQYLHSLHGKPYAGLLAISIFGSAILLPLDPFLIKQVQEMQQPFWEALLGVGAFLGKSHGTWGVLGVIYAGAVLARNEKFRKVIFAALISSGLAGLAVHILKFIFMRARPFTDLGPYHFFDWQGILNNTRDFQSFPSGDVAIISGAAAIFFLAARKKKVGWVFLVFPLLTALSRMDLNKHWPSDTAFSFLISFLAAKFVWDYCKSVIASERSERSNRSIIN